MRATLSSVIAVIHSHITQGHVQHVRTRAALGVVFTILSFGASAADGLVTCTIFVGVKPSYSQTFELDADDSGRGRLFFEANMFTADVDITAINGQIEVGMTLTRRGMDFSDEIVFGLLRGTTRSPARKKLSVINSDLVCKIE